MAQVSFRKDLEEVLENIVRHMAMVHSSCSRGTGIPFHQEHIGLCTDLGLENRKETKAFHCDDKSEFWPSELENVLL